MRRVAFIVCILGLFFLLVALNFFEFRSVDSNNLNELTRMTRVLVEGNVEQERLGKTNYFKIDGVLIRSNHKTSLDGKYVKVYGVIDDFPMRSVRAFIIEVQNSSN